MGTHGYAILVVTIKDSDIGSGRIDADTGMVHYRVKYTAIFLRPYTNEIVDADVAVVTKVGKDAVACCDASPRRIAVSSASPPSTTPGRMRRPRCTAHTQASAARPVGSQPSAPTRTCTGRPLFRPLEPPALPACLPRLEDPALLAVALFCTSRLLPSPNHPSWASSAKWAH